MNAVIAELNRVLADFAPLIGILVVMAILGLLFKIIEWWTRD